MLYRLHCARARKRCRERAGGPGDQRRRERRQRRSRSQGDDGRTAARRESRRMSSPSGRLVESLGRDRVSKIVWRIRCLGEYRRVIARKRRSRAVSQEQIARTIQSAGLGQQQSYRDASLRTGRLHVLARCRFRYGTGSDRTRLFCKSRFDLPCNVHRTSPRRHDRLRFPKHRHRATSIPCRRQRIQTADDRQELEAPNDRQ